MTDLDDTALFVAIADAGGLAAAEARTGQPRSTLSRALKRLEARLGAPLARRTPQGFALTPEGARFHARAARALRELERAREEVSPGRAGRVVRVTAPTLMAQGLLIPALARFRRANPDARVALLVTNDKVDLIDTNVDLAIRAGEAKDERLVARVLFCSVERLYAAPAHLQRFGLPRSPAELRDRPTVHCAGARALAARPVWELTDGVRRERVELRDALAVNDPGTARGLAREGLGVACLPDFLGDEAARRGELVPVLPEWRTDEVLVRAILADGRDASEAVRRLLDELVAMGRTIGRGRA